MFNVFANTFMNATRTHWGAPSHWADAERYDNRRGAELEAHTTGRRRD